MFVTNVVVGDQILDRNFFWFLKDATFYAKEQLKEKVWKLPDGSVFFGDPEVRIYNTRNFKNEHFFSITDTE